MNIYIEVIFIENLILNICTIIILNKILNTNITCTRIIITCIICSLITTVLRIIDENATIAEILVNNILIYFVFKSKNIKEYIKKLIYFYIISFVYIGSVICITLIFNINIEKIYTRIIIYLICYIMCVILTDVLWKMWITKVRYKELTYILEINNIGKFKVFLDTGNFLSYGIEKIPVIIINEKSYIKKNSNKSNCFGETLKPLTMEYKTINGKNELKGYIYKNVVLKKGGDKKYIDKVLITFFDEEIQNGVYDGILPFEILVEK